MYYLPYNKNLKEFSRELRNHSTLGEVLLWNELKGAKFGYTFNRQKPIGNFIVDFYCKPLNLVIEIDGRSHYFSEYAVRDEKKQTYLEAQGLFLLRFTEKTIRFERKHAKEVIANAILIREEEMKLLK